MPGLRQGPLEGNDRYCELLDALSRDLSGKAGSCGFCVCFDRWFVIERLRALCLYEPMVEVAIEVSEEAFAILEEAVFEVAETTRWNLLEDLENKKYRIQGVFESQSEAEGAWGELSEVSGVGGTPIYRQIRDADWQDSYKEHFEPWSIGNLHWVPVWLKDEYELPEGKKAVWLDPGMAFGTGNHETTRLCVERLIETRERLGSSGIEKVSAVDAGCGSGILAISARRLGFRDVRGFDNDPDAVRIAVENAELNGLPELPFSVGDLVSGFDDRRYDIVIANILAVVLIDFRKQIVEAVAEGGKLILSGILAQEAEEVKTDFETLRSWKSIQLDELGEWSSVTLLA